MVPRTMPEPFGAERHVRALVPPGRSPVVALGPDNPIGLGNRGTHVLIVQSSQFSGGFDCAIKNEGGGRDAKR
eukprot:5314212-Amphidinium_carterae.1